jgi:hypothetical protein
MIFVKVQHKRSYEAVVIIAESFAHSDIATEAPKGCYMIRCCFPIFHFCFFDSQTFVDALC